MRMAVLKGVRHWWLVLMSLFGMDLAKELLLNDKIRASCQKFILITNIRCGYTQHRKWHFMR